MRTFFQALVDTFKSIFTDVGVLTIIVIAPLIYGVYYPLPYSNEVIRHLPVAIVDHAQNSLSRKMIRFVSASPLLQTNVVTDELQATQLLRDNEVMGFMVIPRNLSRDIILGRPTIVNMIGNGNYLVAGKNAQKGMASAVLTLSAGIEIRRLAPLALGDAKIQAIRNPVPLQTELLHNLNEGYGSYVVPAVAWVILQQTLLMGCAMLVSTWIESRKAYASPMVWVGRLTMLSLIHYVICIGYTGLMFHFWGYKTGANPIGNIVLIAIYSPCVASVGCLLGLLIKDRERATQLLIFSALPMYFVSGFSWPVQLLPEFLQYVRWLFPSTSAIPAGLSFNQLGGTIVENSHHLITLAVTAWIATSLLFWFGREKVSHPKHKLK